MRLVSDYTIKLKSVFLTFLGRFFSSLVTFIHNLIYLIVKLAIIGKKRRKIGTVIFMEFLEASLRLIQLFILFTS